MPCLIRARISRNVFRSLFGENLFSIIRNKLRKYLDTMANERRSYKRQALR
jgi:hypothetical protein